MDYEPCNTNTRVSACAPNYDCFSYKDDGQDYTYCLQRCTASSQCNGLQLSCQEVTAAKSYCLDDNCGPGLGYDAGQIYGPCQVDAPGDGFCQPYTYDGGVYGQCFLAGTQGPGEFCSGYSSKTLACQENELCFGTQELLPDAGPNETCVPTCNAVTDAGKMSDGCPAGWSCISYGDGRVGNVDPGYCHP